MIAKQLKGRAPWRQENFAQADWDALTGPTQAPTKTISSVSQVPSNGYLPGQIVDVSGALWEIPPALDSFNAMFQVNQAQFVKAMLPGHGAAGSTHFSAARFSVEGDLTAMLPLQNNGGILSGTGMSLKGYRIRSDIDGVWPGDGFAGGGIPSVLEEGQHIGAGGASFWAFPLASSNIPVTIQGLSGSTGAPLDEATSATAVALAPSTVYTAGQLIYTPQGLEALYQVSVGGTSGSGVIPGTNTPWYQGWPGGEHELCSPYSTVFCEIGTYVANTTEGSAIVTGSGFISTMVGGTFAIAGVSGTFVIKSYQSATQITLSTAVPTTVSNAAMTDKTNPFTDGPDSLVLVYISPACHDDGCQIGRYSDCSERHLRIVGFTNSCNFIQSSASSFDVAYSVSSNQGSTILTGTGFVASMVGQTYFNSTLGYVTIQSFQSATQVTMTSTATATASGVTIQRPEPAGPVHMSGCDLTSGGNYWIGCICLYTDPTYGSASAFQGRYIRSLSGVWSPNPTPWFGRPEMCSFTNTLFRDSGIPDAVGGTYQPSFAYGTSGLDAAPIGYYPPCIGNSAYFITNGAASLQSGFPDGDVPTFVRDEATRKRGIAAQTMSNGQPNFAVYEARFQYGIFPGACDARSWIVWNRNRDQRGAALDPVYRAGFTGYDAGGYYTGT